MTAEIGSTNLNPAKADESAQGADLGPDNEPLTLGRAFVSRKDAKTQSFSMRYLCRTAHLPGDGIIACNVLFFFAFLASLREQLPILG